MDSDINEIMDHCLIRSVLESRERNFGGGYISDLPPQHAAPGPLGENRDFVGALITEGRRRRRKK